MNEVIKHNKSKSKYKRKAEIVLLSIRGRIMNVYVSS